MATTATPVRVRIQVAVPCEIAFRIFTDGFTTWWPLEAHHIGKARPIAAGIEPRLGGRLFERGQDGSQCDWGVVRAWEPPARLVLGWQLDADWRHDPACETTVEILFVAEGPGRTRLELEHRDLHRFGPRRDEMRGQLGGAGGWPALLEAYRERADSPRP
jgi:uncharacterized protein YndB with AHSA1/START domain